VLLVNLRSLAAAQAKHAAVSDFRHCATMAGSDGGHKQLECCRAIRPVFDVLMVARAYHVSHLSRTELFNVIGKAEY